MKKNKKKNSRFIIIVILGASIIKDLLVLIFKNSLKHILFQVIHFILIYIYIILLFKTKPAKYLQKEIDSRIKKKKK